MIVLASLPAEIAVVSAFLPKSKTCEPVTRFFPGSLEVGGFNQNSHWPFRYSLRAPFGDD